MFAPTHCSQCRKAIFLSVYFPFVVDATIQLFYLKISFLQHEQWTNIQHLNTIFIFSHENIHLHYQTVCSLFWNLFHILHLHIKSQNITFKRFWNECFRFVSMVLHFIGECLIYVNLDHVNKWNEHFDNRTEPLPTYFPLYICIILIYMLLLLCYVRPISIIFISIATDIEAMYFVFVFLFRSFLSWCWQYNDSTTENSTNADHISKMYYIWYGSWSNWISVYLWVDTSHSHKVCSNFIRS